MCSLVLLIFSDMEKLLRNIKWQQYTKLDVYYDLNFLQKFIEKA